eukprot:TRINITY_DN16555_c0_g1_i1.p1 TRINITY_DN16555_c0_g1~~TRINITY_DN16555_c0_g1_i1.p1  ORF type:complete len:847 (+),score=144.07 TRINITY_DN16555_c0_g1_i1:49-2541(+)
MGSATGTAVRLLSLACGALAIGGCPGSSVPCHAPATGCCDPIWCGSAVTNLTTQACGDQADISAERATPQGAGNVCTCYAGTQQGEGYACVGIHCIRETVDCDTQLTALHQVCAAQSFPSGGSCQCQPGYACTATSTGTRQCVSTSCDFTIFGCESYRSQTRPVGGTCECAACAGGRVLGPGSAECLAKVLCNEASALDALCPSDSRVVDGLCQCNGGWHCEALGAAAGSCVRQQELVCGEKPTAGKTCPLSAPLDPATGECACTGATTCLANKTCGVEMVSCGAAAREAYQLCVEPAAKQNGVCTCPEWATCGDGQCVQARCTGDSIPRCGVYVSETPGDEGCVCRRCIGTGVGVVLSEDRKVCRLEIACSQALLPGSTDQCTAHARPVDGVCECETGYTCATVCVLDGETDGVVTASPTARQVDVVRCGKELPNGVEAVCGSAAAPDADRVCVCGFRYNCVNGSCSRQAKACGSVADGPSTYCRDLEAYRDPTTGVCTCSDDTVCFAGECAANHRGNKATSEIDRKLGGISLIIIGARQEDFVSSSGRTHPAFQSLSSTLISEMHMVDPGFLSQEPCRPLTPPGQSAPLTEAEKLAFASSAPPCMQVTRLCAPSYHAGEAASHANAEFHPDLGDCEDCSCWYPTVGYYGSPYSVGAAVPGSRRASVTATGAPTAPNVHSADLGALGTDVVSIGSQSAVSLGAFRVDLMFRGTHAVLPGDHQYTLTERSVHVDSAALNILAKFCGHRPSGLSACRGFVLNSTSLGRPLKIVSAVSLPSVFLSEGSTYEQYNKDQQDALQVLADLPVSLAPGIPVLVATSFLLAALVILW